MKSHKCDRGDICKYEETRQFIKVCDGRKTRKQRRGRPRMIWDKEVAKLLTDLGALISKQAETLARDRKVWKRLVNES